MKWLNKTNGADKIETKYFTKVKEEFKKDLVGVVMGSAYGGSVEAMGKLWKDVGTVYGCDTFEDLHPGHLHPTPGSFETICMDHWYNHKDFGKEALAFKHQRSVLDSQGLDNVILLKGEVGPDTTKDMDKVHYCFLDMDIPQSMDNGYQAIKTVMVKGSYLLIHDIHNIESVREWYKREVIGTDKKMWEEVGDYPGTLTKALRRA